MSDQSRSRRIREADVQGHFTRAMTVIGCLYRKFDNIAGWPDWIVFWPCGCHSLVELKAPGQTIRPKQRVVHKNLQHRLQHTFIIDTREGVDEFAALPCPDHTSRLQQQPVKVARAKP